MTLAARVLVTVILIAGTAAPPLGPSRTAASEPGIARTAAADDFVCPPGLTVSDPKIGRLTLAKQERMPSTVPLHIDVRCSYGTAAGPIVYGLDAIWEEQPGAEGYTVYRLCENAPDEVRHDRSGDFETLRSTSRRALVTHSTPNSPAFPFDIALVHDFAAGVLRSIEPRGLACGTAPTPSASAAASSVDIAVDHLEVVQVVQNAANTVPLVPGKKTVVRAFVRSTGKVAVPGVTGTLRVSGAGTGSLTPTGSITAPLAIDRAQIGHSLVFVLPVGLTAEGTYLLEVTITHPGLPGDAASSPALKRTIPMTIKQPPKWPDVFTIGYLPICVGLPAPDATAGAWPARPPKDDDDCTAEDRLAGDEGLLKLFPAGEGGLWAIVVGAPAFTWTLPLNTSSSRNRLLVLLRKLYGIYATETAGGIDQLVGWVPGTADTNMTDAKGQSIGYVGGLADTAKVGGHAVWVKETSAIDVRLPQHALPHEIGHNLGLFHITPSDVFPEIAKKSCNSVDPGSGWVDHFKDDNATIHEVGFDTDAMKVIPSTWYDLMSYCSVNGPDGKPSPGIWISEYQYRLLYDSDKAKSELGAPVLAAVPEGVAGALGAARGDGLVVSGSLRRDGSTARLDPAYRVTGARLDASDPKGDTCLRFTGGASPFCFSLTFAEHTTRVPLDQEAFSFVVPAPAGATAVTLTKGARTLATLSGATAPTVAIDQPKAGQTLSGTQTIGWTATGAAAYAVSYSPDGKRTWIPLAVDFAEQQLPVNTKKLLGGGELWFRVSASGGLASAQAEVGPFALSGGRTSGYPRRPGASAAGAAGSDAGGGTSPALVAAFVVLALAIVGFAARRRAKPAAVVAAPAASPPIASPPTAATSATPSSVTSPPAAAPPAGARRFCGGCGAPITPTARFCGACGASLG